MVPAWELPFRCPMRGLELEKWEPKSVQVDVSELTEGAEDSSALPRVTGPAKDFVRGSIHNRPFHPGGLDDSQSLGRILPDGALNGEWVGEVLNSGAALAVAPSFKEGMDLGKLKAHTHTWNVYEDQRALRSKSDTKLNTLSVQFDDLFKKAWEEDVSELAGDGHTSEPEEVDTSTKLSATSDIEANELDVGSSAVALNSEPSVLDEILSVYSRGSTSRLDVTSDGGGQQPKEGWALTGDTQGIADHFHELVPDMALDFPFELDSFEKERPSRCLVIAVINVSQMENDMLQI